MKIPQYIQIQKHNVGNGRFLSSQKFKNKSFQKELWNQVWSEHSFEELVNQLTTNPIYWRLKELIKNKDKILEAGCGFGQWVYRLSLQGYKITGVDIAEKTIKNIKKRFPYLDIRISDVEKLPLKDKSFDVYLSFGVIEHFRDGPEQVLTEAYRVLKKNGLLFLTAPYLNIWRFLRYGLNPQTNGHFYQYLYTKGELIDLIGKSGFSISEVTNYDFINALRKDFPFLANILFKYRHPEDFSSKRTTNKFVFREVKPNFRLQEFLYKLDSYVVLIEARKQ